MPASGQTPADRTGTPSSAGAENAAFERLRDWALHRLLPFWAEAGVTSAGHFVEDLDFAGRPCPAAALHTRVQARQVYTFAHAALLTGSDHYRRRAVDGFARMADLLWDGENGGWRHSVTPEGSPVDSRCDAYDQCFALLALAWLARLGEAGAAGWIERSLAALDRRLGAPRHGGYLEFAPSATGMPLPRRQNPHMHLLESFLALEEAGFAAEAAPLSDAIADLFVPLIERDGSVAEYFTEDWAPAPGEKGLAREPGHQFEWAWLLLVYAGRRQSTRGAGAQELAHKLAHAGWRHGFDSAAGRVPALIEVHDAAGGPLVSSKLLWPQTEAIKYVAQCRHDALTPTIGDTDALTTLVATLFDHFIIDGGPLWRNQIAQNGTPTAATVPARLLYHIMTAVGVIAPKPATPAPPAG